MLPTGSTLVTKDPDAILPKGIDWTTWLARLSPTETIDTSAWTITGPDASLTFQDDSIVTGALKTQLRLVGGTRGRRYKVTNRIVSSSGAQEDRSFPVKIKQE